MIAAPSRDLFLTKVKADFSKEGKFLAYKAEFLMNVGAYADCTVNVSKTAGYSAEGVTKWSISQNVIKAKVKQGIEFIKGTFDILILRLL